MSLQGPEKKIIKKTEMKTVKPASYEDIDTGERQEIKIRDSDGEVRIEERPITERVFHDAVRQSVEKESEVHVVTDDHGDEHEFSSVADAKNFMKETVRGI